MIEWLNFE